MGLSKEQERVLGELRKGLYIWTNEGRNFRVWLGDDEGRELEGLRKRTVEVLFEKEIIKVVEGDYRDGLYKYTIR